MTNQNFNDDVAERPFLHGAYEVKESIFKGDNAGENFSSVKRFFIHRNGYIIFQDYNDQMKDFRLDIDRSWKMFVLTDYNLNRINLGYMHREKEGVLEIQYFDKDGEYILKAKSFDWKKLPLMRNDFHWAVDK
ncbi:MAG: hypothetical protein K2X86_10595 [Cytophagaceae bacterium]|nr:hypothetical protein [Cytophagaceae bacterium]